MDQRFVNYKEKYPLFETNTVPQMADQARGAPYPDSIGDCIQYPHLLPPYAQRWMPTKEHPYPMNFVQAPSAQHQIIINQNGRPMYQGLSINKGPVSYPIKVPCNRGPVNTYERKHSAIVYPTTHSIPGPYLQSYIRLPNKMYMY